MQMNKNYSEWEVYVYTYTKKAFNIKNYSVCVYT
jgi:hypothetical protein